MFSESQLDRYRQMVARALGFLRSSDDRLAEMADLCAHYKAPYLYASSGDRVLSRKYLDFIVERYMQPDGDLRTSPDDKGWAHLRNSPANRYIYANGWMIVGFQRMGAYGAAARALAFVKRFQSAELGGFFSRYDIPSGQIETRYLDTSSTSSAGLALLACGQIADATRAGDFVLRVLDAQPDLGSNLFSSWDAQNGLMTELEGDESLTAMRGRKQYCLSAEKDALGELVWMVGKPMMFLARLFDATGRQRFLTGAETLFEYFHRLSDSRWQNPACCKTMWAASELYRLTGQARYVETVKRILDGFVESQHASGSWVHTMRYESWEVQPFAASVDAAQEICGEVGDVIFNVTATGG